MTGKGTYLGGTKYHTAISHCAIWHSFGTLGFEKLIPAHITTKNTRCTSLVTIKHSQTTKLHNI